MSGLLLDGGLQLLNSCAQFRQLHIDGLPARLVGASGNMSRVCRVGRRFSREGLLCDAHVGCHGQQADTDETGCDDWDLLFHIQLHFSYSVCVFSWFAP